MSQDRTRTAQAKAQTRYRKAARAAKYATLGRTGGVRRGH
jgi:hypothetical protein